MRYELINCMCIDEWLLRTRVWDGEAIRMSLAGGGAGLQMRMDRGRHGLGAGSLVTSGRRMPALQPALLQYAVVQFFLAPVGGGLHEGQNDGVRLLFGGRQLRLEERGQEKTVRRRFDRADFALGAARHYGESRFHGRPFKVRIDFEVAEVLFGRGLFSLSVKRLQVGAGTQANLRDRAG